MLGIGLGVYVVSCEIYKRMNIVHAVASHDWNMMGGQFDDIVPLLRSPCQGNFNIHGEKYTPLKFHILNPFQYFSWLQCVKVAEESHNIHKKYHRYNRDFENSMDYTLILKDDIQVPIKYNIVAFKCPFYDNPILSITPIYASSKTLKELSIWRRAKTDAVGTIDEKTGEKWLFIPLQWKLRGETTDYDGEEGGCECEE